MESLRNYVQAPGMGQKRAAALFGVSQSMVSHWLKGRERITAERAIQIEQATAGAVTRADLRPDLFADQQRAA